MVNRHLALVFTALSALALASCASSPPAEPAMPPPYSGPVSIPDTGGRPVIAYALGSGAARGFAHVGVLNALDAAGIGPDLIVGTSSGSLVGALYAAGIRGDALTKLAMETDRDDLIDYTTSKQGVIIGKHLEDFVNKKLGGRPLEALEIPVAVVSTELYSGEKAVFTRGDSGLAVRAASSFPGLFKPVTIADRVYVDGGVLSPVPVDTAIDLGANIVIAVDVARPPSRDRDIDGWIDILHQSYLIMARAISAVETAHADVVIRPDIGDMSLLDFNQRRTAIDAGAAAAAESIPTIKHLISVKSNSKP